VDHADDTRLHPDRSERATFLFPAGATRITAQLWYRRFWHEVAETRDWRDNDTLIIEKTLALP
jgi:hypothetical protein